MISSFNSALFLSTAAFFPEQIYAPGNQRPNDEKCQSRVKSIAHFYLQKEDSVVKGKKHTPSGKSYPKCSGGASGVFLPGLFPDYPPTDDKQWDKADDEGEGKLHRLHVLIGRPGSLDFLFQLR